MFILKSLLVSKTYFILLGWLILIPLSQLGFSQSIPDASSLKDYQEKYPESEAILLESILNYDFRIDDRTQNLYIVEERIDKVLSLKNQNTLLLHSTYDEYSEMLKAWAYDEERNEIILEPTCGNYDIDGFFYSDAQACTYPLKFARAGEIQIIHRQKKYSDPKYLTSIYFHDYLPLVHKKISLAIPHYVEVDFSNYNWEGFDIRENRVLLASLTQRVTYEVDNLDILKSEENAPSLAHTYPHFIVLTKSYEWRGQKKRLLSSVDDLYNWYASLTQNLDNRSEILQPLVDSLSALGQTDLEKVKNIYYWVQDNIRYIAFEDGLAGFQPESAYLVYQKKYGDCKGMANLTKEMLKLAGFDARLTWIGTARVPYDYSLPSLIVDNHMICTLMLSDKQYFLDATEKFIPLGDYAERIQGQDLLIENGTSYQLAEVPHLKPANNLLTRSQKLRIEGEKLIGKAQYTYNGETKRQLLNILNSLAPNPRKEFLELFFKRDNKNVQIQNIQLSDIAQREPALTFDFDINLINQIDAFDNDLYINLEIYQDLQDKIIETQRLSDLDWGEKYYLLTEIELEIPEGYKVTHLPDPLTENNQEFLIELTYKQQENKIIYSKKVLIPQRIIQKPQLEHWNKTLKMLINNYNDRIVLSKTN